MQGVGRHEETAEVFGRLDSSRIYLIRHGRPRSSWGGSDQDPGLDARGAAEARAACEHLMDLPPALRPRDVVNSPLRRCLETAMPLAEALGQEIIIDPAVGEIPTPGSLSPEERPAWLRAAFEGGWGDIGGDIDYAAWRRTVTAALAAHAGLAVFSHFVAINAAVSLIEGQDRVVVFHPGHASITELEVRGGALALVKRGAEAETGVL